MENESITNGCQTFSHIINGEKHYKPKKKYLTDKEAISVAAKINSRASSIHKIVVYKCNKCGYYHLGHHKTKVLTDKDKEHYKKMLSWYY